MRTTKDRLRHALSFEIIALFIVIPLGAWIFSRPLGDIGIVSVVGYLPDTFIPLINGYLTEHYPGALGYQLYFGYIGAVGLVGTLAAVVLRGRVTRKQRLLNTGA